MAYILSSVNANVSLATYDRLPTQLTTSNTSTTFIYLWPLLHILKPDVNWWTHINVRSKQSIVNQQFVSLYGLFLRDASPSNLWLHPYLFHFKTKTSCYTSAAFKNICIE